MREVLVAVADIQSASQSVSQSVSQYDSAMDASAVDAASGGVYIFVFLAEEQIQKFFCFSLF